ncbi:MAG: hypothetical protein ACE5F8_01735 [Woeseiaceae bacterium]
MSRDKKDEEMIYGLTADERDALQAGLGVLPDTMPPRAVWHRIREQAEAEGLIKKPRSQQPQTWFVGGSIAAAVFLSALILPGRFEAQDPIAVPDSGYTVPPVAGTGSEPGGELTTLQTLMVESRQLEDDLRAIPHAPRVKRAGTQATILDLEDRIAGIDYQLNDKDIQLTPEEEEIFWRERVRLMKSLVQLRIAQSQRTSF